MLKNQFGNDVLTEPDILTFICNNCGKQLLSGVQKRENMIIREPKMYCSECYYMAIQQNRQYRIRNELLEKQNREHMTKSKELRGIIKVRAIMEKPLYKESHNR